MKEKNSDVARLTMYLILSGETELTLPVQIANYSGCP